MPHTPLAEFHVQLMVTLSFAGPPSPIKFHSIDKKAECYRMTGPRKKWNVG